MTRGKKRMLFNARMRALTPLEEKVIRMLHGIAGHTLTAVGRPHRDVKSTAEVKEFEAAVLAQAPTKNLPRR